MKKIIALILIVLVLAGGAKVVGDSITNSTESLLSQAGIQVNQDDPLG